jgi:hypothetical protein
VKIDSIGQVLCGREFDVRDGRAVSVIMGMPQQFPDGQDDYFCPFRIIGMGDEQIRYGVGVDALQAVWLTLQMIGARSPIYESRSKERRPVLARAIKSRFPHS